MLLRGACLSKCFVGLSSSQADVVRWCYSTESCGVTDARGARGSLGPERMKKKRWSSGEGGTTEFRLGMEITLEAMQAELLQLVKLRCQYKSRNQVLTVPSQDGNGQGRPNVCMGGGADLRGKRLLLVTFTCDF